MFLGVNLLAIVTIYFFFPETRGLVLEEVAEIFDGPSADVSIAARAHAMDDDASKGLDEKLEYRE